MDDIISRFDRLLTLLFFNIVYFLLNIFRWWKETFPSSIATKVARGERPTHRVDHHHEHGSGGSESGSVITYGLASVMKDCWKDDPTERMTFKNVLDELDMLTRKSRRLSSSSTSMSFERPNTRESKR